MREGYALVRRAAAATAVAVALHPVVAPAPFGGSLLLGAMFLAARGDGEPLIVDMVAVEGRPAGRAAPPGNPAW